jgi:hypothetical protein
MKIGGEQFVHVGKNWDGVFGRCFRGTGLIRLDSRDQSDALARRFQFAIDAQMIPAEGSGPGNGNA